MLEGNNKQNQGTGAGSLGSVTMRAGSRFAKLGGYSHASCDVERVRVRVKRHLGFGARGGSAIAVADSDNCGDSVTCSTTVVSCCRQNTFSSGSLTH